jgi:hypothetical protein
MGITFDKIQGKVFLHKHKVADIIGVLKLDQTTPQTITGGIPLLTNLTPTTDYMIATKKYVDDNAGGAPGGVDHDIQYNDAGAFGGSSNFAYDGTRLYLYSYLRTDNVLNSDTNIFLGYDVIPAGLSTGGTAYKGLKNINIGHTVGKAITEGYGNVSIGYRAGESVTTGHDSVFIGVDAGRLVTTASYNIILGAAGQKLTGGNCIMMGSGAGVNATTGVNIFSLGVNSFKMGNPTYSVAIGKDAGYNFSAGYSAFIGDASGYNCNGSYNVGIGANSLEGSSSTNTPQYNVAIGFQSSKTIGDVDNNVTIGYRSGYSGPGGGCVFIGANAGYNETGSNKLYIENSNSATPLIYGEFDNNLVKIYGSLYIGDASNYSKFEADGILTMTGTARVLNDLWIDAGGIKAPGSKPASQVDWGIGIAWEFSDGTDDTIIFNMKVPSRMDRSVAPTLKIGWSSGATEKVGVWQLEYLWTKLGEATDAAAQETLETTGTTPVTADGLVVSSFTGIDVPDSDDVCLHCRLKRLGADGDDTLSDTAELHGVCLEFTTNKLGTAT